MNVASLELCRDLPQTWNDTEYLWVVTSNATSVWRNDGQWDINGIDVFPAPGLGYLLRKLPRDPFIAISARPNGYSAVYYVGDMVNEVRADADTPEDAACLLAIELLNKTY